MTFPPPRPPRSRPKSRPRGTRKLYRYPPAPPRWTTLAHAALATPGCIEVYVKSSNPNFLSLAYTYVKPGVHQRNLILRGKSTPHHNHYSIRGATIIPQLAPSDTTEHYFCIPPIPGCWDIYYAAFDGTNPGNFHSISPIWALSYCLLDPDSSLIGYWQRIIKQIVSTVRINPTTVRRSFKARFPQIQPFDQLFYICLTTGSNLIAPFTPNPGPSPWFNRLNHNFASPGGYTDKLTIWTLAVPAGSDFPTVAYEFASVPFETSDLDEEIFSVPVGSPPYSWHGRVLLPPLSPDPFQFPALYFSPVGLTNIFFGPSQSLGTPFTLQQGAPSDLTDHTKDWRKLTPQLLP